MDTPFVCKDTTGAAVQITHLRWKGFGGQSGTGCGGGKLVFCRDDFLCDTPMRNMICVVTNGPYLCVARYGSESTAIAIKGIYMNKFRVIHRLACG